MKILWLALIFYIPVCAQESVEVKYLIRYNDNLNVKDPQYRRHDGVLRIDGTRSFFYMAAIDKHPNSTPEMSRIIDTTFLVMTDLDKNELYALDFTWGSGFLWVKDSLYPMTWNIDTVTKKVGELNCTKATCNFRGRNYTAWFSNDIPKSKGPWKFGGLPGLIVELEDSQRHFVVSFAKVTNGTKPVKLPSAKMEWKEFVVKKKIAQEDFVTSIKAAQKSDCLTCKTEVSLTMGETLEKYW